MTYRKLEPKRVRREDLRSMFDKKWVILTDCELSKGLVPITGVLYEAGDYGCMDEREQAFRKEHPGVRYSIEHSHPEILLESMATGVQF